MSINTGQKYLSSYYSYAVSIPNQRVRPSYDNEIKLISY